MINELDLLRSVVEDEAPLNALLEELDRIYGQVCRYPDMSIKGAIFKHLFRWVYAAHKTPPQAQKQRSDTRYLDNCLADARRQNKELADELAFMRDELLEERKKSRGRLDSFWEISRKLYALKDRNAELDAINESLHEEIFNLKNRPAKLNTQSCPKCKGDFVASVAASYCPFCKELLDDIPF